MKHIMKPHDIQRGFTAIEAVLVVVVVALLGAVSYLFYAHQKVSNKNSTPSDHTAQAATATNNASTPHAGSYDGWKSYTLAHEKLSFKYPSAWQLKNSSNDSGMPAGSDFVTLTGTDAIGGDTFRMQIYAGNFDFTLPSGGLHVKSASPVTFAGKQGWLVAYDGDAGSNQVLDTELSQSKDKLDFFGARNVNGGNAEFNVSLQFDDDMPHDLQQVQASNDYQEGKLVVESMSY